MSEVTILKQWLVNKQDQFLSSMMEELQEWDNKVGATELASTIKSLLSAKTTNNAGFEVSDNKTILDTVKLVLQLNWIKTWNTVNINLFSVNKPWKDSSLDF